MMKLSMLAFPKTITPQRRMFHKFSALQQPGACITTPKDMVHPIGIQLWSSSKLGFVQPHQTTIRYEHSGKANTTKKVRPNYNGNKRRGVQSKRQRQGMTSSTSDRDRHTVVETEWIRITGIPPLSTLEDLLIDLERIMTAELEMGIIDLDAYEKEMMQQIERAKSPTMDPIVTDDTDWTVELEEYEKLVLEPAESAGNAMEEARDQVDPKSHSEEKPGTSLWAPDSNLPPHMVVEAYPILSTLFRTKGWYLRLPNRSCAHALFSHLSEAKQQLRAKGSDSNDTEQQVQLDTFIARPLKCACKEVTVHSYQPKKHILKEARKLNISDNVIRVENCCSSLTEDEIMYFFSSFRLTTGSFKAVEQVVKGGVNNSSTPSTTSTFLVRFDSPSDARAALREKQDHIISEKSIRLVQYPRCIV